MRLKATVFSVTLFFGVVIACDQGASAAGLPPSVQALVDASGGHPTVQQLDAYLASHPSDGDVFALRCTLKLMQAETNDTDRSVALPDCRKGVALAPSSAFARLRLADVLYDMSSFAESLSAYTEAIALGANTSQIYWKRCDAYRRVGKLDDALSDCNRAVELAPQDFFPLYTRGRLRVTMSNYTDAIPDLSAALELNPKAIDALYWRGAAYAALAKFQQADSDFTAAIAQGDQSPDTYFERGQVRLALGHTHDGITDLAKAAARYRMMHENGRANAALKILTEAETPPPSAADTPAPQGLEVGGVQFSQKEVATFLLGMTSALDPNDHHIHLTVHIADPNSLRPSGTSWQYDRSSRLPDGSYSVTVSVASGLDNTKQEKAIACGLYLGLADSGYGGSKWKALYDKLTADQRRELAQDLAGLYMQLASAK